MRPRHPALNRWISEVKRLCQPGRTIWITGSDAEKKRLEKLCYASGELIRLNQRKLPGCSYHRTAPNDVARTEHLTYICTPTREEAGPTNNWMDPAEATDRAKAILKGSMKGRTMYVIPFTMGLPDSPFAKVGVQVTDSAYVALNMRIMTHVGKAALDRLGVDGDFTRCLHAKADLNPERRLILHFPQDNAVWSVGSGYGGNALLGKKCLALRIASHQGQKEGWLAEHMLIMGIEDPDGQVTYVAAAFPSACGKTNLAMLVPPAEFRKKGYRVWTVGDDIAWLRIDENGELRAVNPEAGFFGVAPGTNSVSNPNAMAAMQRNSIFTNVLLRKDGTVWWEGGDGPTPTDGTDWRGRPWRPGQLDENGSPIIGAHPNSRFTAPLAQCPSFSPHYRDPQGVRISAILLGGRRAHLAPLVYEAQGWDQGVYAGATMASERTAAQEGSLGEVRRDPFAMLPFCGYDMGRYFQHWLDMGRRTASPPRIFHVNWFRKNAEGRFIWPGFGDNFRVLLWIIDRCRYRVSARETALGYVPFRRDLNLAGMDMESHQWQDLFHLDKEEWAREMASRERFIEKVGDTFPAELLKVHDELRARIDGLGPDLEPEVEETETSTA